MPNKLWFSSICLNLHPHFWHRCCSREMLWKSSTPCRQSRLTSSACRNLEALFPLAAAHQSTSVLHMGRSSWTMCWFSRGCPKAYLNQGKESQWLHDALILPPRPKSYLGQKQMLNEPKKKTPQKKGEIYFSAPSVVPWSVQWDITTLLTICVLVSHSQAPVHITSVKKTWCFSSLRDAALACVALGCVPLSLSCACVLKVQKMPAKQITTKSSECPELSPTLKERWRWVDLPTKWLGR